MSFEKVVAPHTPFGNFAVYNPLQESQMITPHTSRRRHVCLRCDRFGAIRSQLHLLHPCAATFTSLHMDPHIHIFIHEMFYVMQYNAHFYVDQQMYTDAFNDQLSNADTEDYSDLPELVDE
jgi:hypothetical protein